MDTKKEFQLRLVQGDEPMPIYNDLPEDPAQRALLAGVLMALMTSLDAKDSYTKGHSERVAHVASAIATKLNFDAHEIELIRMAGMVHDLGKIGVPEAVLRKAGRLTDSEFAQIKLHPDVGRKIVAEIPLLFRITPAVLHHHERWDGSGYPSKIAGESIPMYARILAVADAFDAMRSSRCYSTPMGREACIEEIARNSGKQFDPEVVAAFEQIDLTRYDEMLSRHSAQTAAA